MTTRVLILGGGFGGIYAALAFDRMAPEEFQVTVVDRNNFFLFTPLLSEIASSSIDTRHSVNPIRRLLKRGHFSEGTVLGVDFTKKEVSVRLPTGRMTEMPYDHLVLALGSVPNFFDLPGVREHALPMKTLGDAIVLRNRVIQRLEEADVSKPEDKGQLLTFVMAGGGTAGIEIAGDLNDFIRDAAKAYRHISDDEIRVVLVEAGAHLTPELGLRLGRFAEKKLRQRGLEVYTEAPVLSATADAVTVGKVGVIHTRNLVWTAGVAPTPFAQKLDLPMAKGRILTDQCLKVEAVADVWAIGDLARIPDGRGGYQPGTAQHAIREGSHVAKNIAQAVRGEALNPFTYRTLGSLATVGHQSAVANLMGIKLSGWPAWWLWRTYYLFRLPRLEKRVRVVLDWTLDLIFPRDIVELSLDAYKAPPPAHDIHGERPL